MSPVPISGKSLRFTKSPCCLLVSMRRYRSGGQESRSKRCRQPGPEGFSTRAGCLCVHIMAEHATGGWQKANIHARQSHGFGETGDRSPTACKYQIAFTFALHDTALWLLGVSDGFVLDSIGPLCLHSARNHGVSDAHFLRPLATGKWLCVLYKETTDDMLQAAWSMVTISQVRDLAVETGA